MPWTLARLGTVKEGREAKPTKAKERGTATTKAARETTRKRKEAKRAAGKAPRTLRRDAKTGHAVKGWTTPRARQQRPRGPGGRRHGHHVVHSLLGDSGPLRVPSCDKSQVRQVRDNRILGVRFAPPYGAEPEKQKILKVSGSLLVDSEACVSACRPEAFPDLQPASQPKNLYSVDSSRLKTKDNVQPSLLLGERSSPSRFSLR